MAVKALFAITNWEPDTEGNWQVRMRIWSGVNNQSDILNDEVFAPGALSATVNASLAAFVKAYIQSEWSVSFNPLTDSVRCVNPVSLL